MTKNELQTPSAANKNRLTTSELRISYAQIGLLATAFFSLLTACGRKDISPTDIQQAINDQLTAAPTSALTTTKNLNQPDNSISRVAPEASIETTDPTVASTPNTAFPLIEPTESAPITPSTPESAANLYFKVPFELSPHQERAMRAIQSGAFLEIRGIDNGADLCKEDGCFRARLDVNIGLSGISIAATGPFVSAYKPESPFSNDPEGYTEESAIVSWSTDTYFNLHNRNNFRYMNDSAWANSEALKLGDEILVLSPDMTEEFKFRVIDATVLPRSNNFYREAMALTADKYGGGRLVFVSCTKGGRDANNLLVITAIPLDLENTIDELK